MQILYQVRFSPDHFTLLFTKLRSNFTQNSLSSGVTDVPWAIQWKFILMQSDWELAFFKKLTSLSGAVNSHNHIHSHYLEAFLSRRILWAS